MSDSNATSTLIRLDSDVEKVKRGVENDAGCKWRKPVVVVAGLLVVAVITLCIETMYILQLHGEQTEINNMLLNKVSEMDHRMSSCQCQSKPSRVADVQQNMHDGMSLKWPTRVKRQLLNPPATTEAPLTEDDYNETEHIKNEHHGIASSHIALLYADPEILNGSTGSREPDHSVLKFTNSSEVNERCGRMMKNGNGDMWCIPPFPAKQRHSVMLTGRIAYYPYLAQAPWMHGERAAENFEVTQDEQMMLVVKKAGIYIVTSSMHFEDVPHGMLHYGVYVRDRLNSIDSERLVGVCASSVNPGPGQQDGTLYPCNTWQLAPLKKGDRVFFKINPFVWIRVQKETFFLALIKLNDWNF